ncbi:MAG: helix-turn-helix domain-containing protein [Bacteroidales bacterium]|jgi:predicted DNA binding protein
MITSITKKQLAQKMGVSQSTLQKYLNNIWFEKLKELNYVKRQRILTPKQLELIKNIWGEFETNNNN